MKAYLALLSVLACVALTLAQNCELQHAPQIAAHAREQLGSEDFAYSSWLNLYAPWYERKDNWFVAACIEAADIEGGYEERGMLIKHQVAMPTEKYLQWWYLAAGDVHSWNWEQVNCEQPCVGDIMAGTIDGQKDSELAVGVVTDAARRVVTRVSHDSDAVVEDNWGFRYFADPETRDPFICWRYQTHAGWY